MEAYRQRRIVESIIRRLKIVMLLERNREKLEKELPERKKEVLQKYTDCYDEYVYLITELAFSDGFCLACRLLSEALTVES